MSCKVLTIAQQKGGAGKTTLAAHLAVAFSQRGLRTAVVDIDPQGSLSRWHAVREERFGAGYTGLTFAAVSGWRVGSEISRLRREHDLVIIDSPPHTETEARTAIRNADLIVIPVQPSPTDVWATQATIDIAGHEQITHRLLFNRVSSHSKLAQTYAESLPHLLDTMLGNRVGFAAALMEGRCVTETTPSGPAAQEIKALVAELWPLLELSAYGTADGENADATAEETALEHA